jgi:hypothetical protein
MKERVPTVAEIRKALELYKSFKTVIVACGPMAAKAAQEADQMSRMMRDFIRREEEALADYKNLLRQRKRALKHEGSP